ncbi:MAG: hypothetical protein WCP97_05290 [bacterium]
MNPETLQEKVLVVPSSKIYIDGKWEGMLTSKVEKYLDVIHTEHFFLSRELAEFDPTHQQIIPYLVFRSGKQYFVIKKLKGSSEKRLHQKFMMGVGGHINEEDSGVGENILEAGIKREWEEEVLYSGNYTKRLVGILSDSKTPVSEVHLGLVYLVEGDSHEIDTAEPEKMSGELVHESDLRQYYENMDSWGRIIIRWIEQGQPVGDEVFA